MAGSKETAPRGPDHYAWKGKDARPETQRERCQRMYPLDGVVCEHKGCEKPATDRHHVSGDTNDNRRENIQLLCRRHHMEVDGRLDALREMVPPVQPPKPCANCGVPSKPLRKGRCHACNEYLRRHGVERTPENSRTWPSESPKRLAA